MAKTKEVSTLAAGIVAKVGKMFAEAFTLSHNAAGAAIATFCKAAGEFLPKVPSDADLAILADAVSAELGWQGTKREGPNKSDAKAVFKQHALLPQAIDELRTATGGCDYHATTRLARRITELGNVGDAVKAMVEIKAASKADPMVKITSALNTFVRIVSEGKRKNKQDLLTAAETFAKSIGVELKKV